MVRTGRGYSVEEFVSGEQIECFCMHRGCVGGGTCPEVACYHHEKRASRDVEKVL